MVSTRSATAKKKTTKVETKTTPKKKLTGKRTKTTEPSKKVQPPLKRKKVEKKPETVDYVAKNKENVSKTTRKPVEQRRTSPRNPKPLKNSVSRRTPRKPIMKTVMNTPVNIPEVEISKTEELHESLHHTENMPKSYIEVEKQWALAQFDREGLFVFFFTVISFLFILLFYLVNSKCLAMERKKRQLLQQLQMDLAIQLLQIPKQVRSMPVSTLHSKFAGNFQDAQQAIIAQKLGSTTAQ